MSVHSCEMADGSDTNEEMMSAVLKITPHAEHQGVSAS